MKRSFKVVSVLILVLMLVACGDVSSPVNNISNLTSAPLPTVTPIANGPTPMLGLVSPTAGAPALNNSPTAPIAVVNTPVPVVVKPPVQPSVNVAQPDNGGNNNNEGDNNGQAKGDDKNKGNGKGGDKKPKK